MVFGDPKSPTTGRRSTLTIQTEAAIAAVLRRDERIDPATLPRSRRIVSAIMFLSMAATPNDARTVEDILREIRDQVRVLLPR